MKRSASQHNDKPANFKVETGKGDSQGGKGSVSRVLGPMTTTRKISNAGLSRENVGPKGAPIIDKGSY